MKKFTFLQEAVVSLQNQSNNQNNSLFNLLQLATTDGYINNISTYFDINELFLIGTFFKLNPTSLSGGLKQDLLGDRKTVFLYLVKTNNFSNFRKQVQTSINNYMKLQNKNNNTNILILK